MLRVPGMDEQLPMAQLYCATRSLSVPQPTKEEVRSQQALVRAQKAAGKAERAKQKQPAAWRAKLHAASDSGTEAIAEALAEDYGSLVASERRAVLTNLPEPWDAFYTKQQTSGYKDRHYVSRSRCRARSTYSRRGARSLNGPSFAKREQGAGGEWMVRGG